MIHPVDTCISKKEKGKKKIAKSSLVVYNDGLSSSLDVQLTDLSGRPAKSEHLHVDQDEALIFYFLLLLSVL